MARAVRRQVIQQPPEIQIDPEPIMPGSPVSPDERIARAAYERFQTRGGQHGHDQEDWFAAERELNGRRDD
jgi:hypothetical protein